MMSFLTNLFHEEVDLIINNKLLKDAIVLFMTAHKDSLVSGIDIETLATELVTAIHLLLNKNKNAPVVDTAK